MNHDILKLRTEETNFNDVSPLIDSNNICIPSPMLHYTAICSNGTMAAEHFKHSLSPIVKIEKRKDEVLSSK